jgi:hypothetical protein
MPRKNISPSLLAPNGGGPKKAGLASTIGANLSFKLKCLKCKK